MADFNALDPQIACHPILPANVSTDEVRYSAIVGINLDVDGLPRPAQIPLPVVVPDFFANVSVGSATKRRAIETSIAIGPALLPSWTGYKINTLAEPDLARVTDLETLLGKRSVQIGEKQVPIELDQGAVTSLLAGQPALVRLVDSTKGNRGEILLQPDFHLPQGDYLAAIDGAGFKALLTTGEIHVAGVGKKSVKLDAEKVAQFLRTGQAVFEFSKRSSAKLTLLLQSDENTAPRPMLVPQQAGMDMSMLAPATLNVADKYGVRMFSAAQLSQPVVGSTPGFQLPNTGLRPPPPPPSASGGDVHQVVPIPQAPGTVHQNTLPPPPPRASVPSFPLVLYLPYLQKWTLNGYARGALLNSLSLAPHEETTIEIFSWERHRREIEATSLSETESLLEGSVNNKDTHDVVDEAKRENGWKVGVEASFSVPGVPIGGKVGAEIRDVLTKTSKTTAQQINDATIKASFKVKSTRQTKVIEASEFGSETKVVRRLRNPNLGRTLNLDCFEVVAHYGVETKLDVPGVRLGVLAEMYDFLAPMLMAGPGQKEALLAFEHVLEPLVPSKLRSGFNAAKLLLSAERYCRFRCTPSCSCDQETKSKSDKDNANAGGRTVITAEDDIKRELSDALGRVRTAINAIAAADVANLGRTIKQHWDYITEPTLQPSQAQWEAGRLEVKRYLFRRFIMNGPATRFWSEARSAISTSGNDEAVARQLSAARKAQGADVINAVAAYLSIQVKVVAELATVVGSWPLVVVDMIASGLGFDDAGLETALDRIQAALERLDNLRVPAGTGKTGGQGDGLPPEIDALREQGLNADYAPKELSAASIELDSLARYLSNNANFYRVQLWRSIDPADRLRFLAIYGKLASFTTGRILGFIGTSAVLEVDVTSDVGLDLWFKRTVESNSELTQSGQTFKAILPTPGVTLEARLGVCDALEPYLTESRSIELLRNRSLANQDELEAKRMGLRLDKKDYSDPRERPPLILTDKPAAP